jgi:hypothetical protein
MTIRKISFNQKNDPSQKRFLNRRRLTQLQIVKNVTGRKPREEDRETASKNLDHRQKRRTLFSR